MLIWRLALRNLFRHQGRLVLNLILLVGGITTIACFKGFKSHILNTIQDMVVNTQTGHLQVAKKIFWDNTPVEQVTDKMMDNSSELINQIMAIKDVRFVSPRIEFYGLINTMDNSVSAHFIGFDPHTEDRFQKNIILMEGQPLAHAKHALISIGLKSKLAITSNDDATIVAPTLVGGINATDVSVSGIFSSGFAEIDNGTVFLPLTDAQNLLDSSHVDRLVISLHDEHQLPIVKNKIDKLLGASELQVKEWTQIAELYTQVRNFYIFQNIIIEFIIISLLILCVTNTVSMTVFERLGEIGTLRAMGEYELDIQKLFLIESVLLGLLAIAISIPVCMMTFSIIKELNLSLTLPLASQPIAVVLVPTWSGFLEAFLACLFSVVTASVWPSYRGANTPIITALGTKI